jgi:hypothetical protein
LGDTIKFTAQHDARRIANGNITLFDNGTYSSLPTARAIEYQLDEENKTATAVWQFHEPNGFSSVFIGNTNRLPNGNTLIDWGGAFPLEVTTSFTEVDASGNIVMELDFISSNYVSYRSIKQDVPFSINRPEIDCDGINFTLSAPEGYDSYHWNTGAETQSITIVDTGTYQVWVNQGIGFISSEIFHISNLAAMCNTSQIKQITNPKVQLYPNPATEYITIEFTEPQKTPVQIYNNYGRLVKEITLEDSQNSQRFTIDISELSPGLYFLRSGSTCKKFIKQ